MLYIYSGKTYFLFLPPTDSENKKIVHTFSTWAVTGKAVFTVALTLLSEQNESNCTAPSGALGWIPAHHRVVGKPVSASFPPQPKISLLSSTNRRNGDGNALSMKTFNQTWKVFSEIKTLTMLWRGLPQASIFCLQSSFSLHFYYFMCGRYVRSKKLQPKETYSCFGVCCSLRARSVSGCRQLLSRYVVFIYLLFCNLMLMEVIRFLNFSNDGHKIKGKHFFNWRFFFL